RNLAASRSTSLMKAFRIRKLTELGTSDFGPTYFPEKQSAQPSRKLTFCPRANPIGSLSSGPGELIGFRALRKTHLGNGTPYAPTADDGKANRTPSAWMTAPDLVPVSSPVLRVG